MLQQAHPARGAPQERRVVGEIGREYVQIDGVRGETALIGKCRLIVLATGERVEAPLPGIAQPSVQARAQHWANVAREMTLPATVAHRMPSVISSTRSTAVAKMAPGSDTAGKPMMAAV